MNHTVHNNIVSFIWGIADDVLRDVYVCGKYRDVILPMTVMMGSDSRTTTLCPTLALGSATVTQRAKRYRDWPDRG